MYLADYEDLFDGSYRNCCCRQEMATWTPSAAADDCNCVGKQLMDRHAIKTKVAHWSTNCSASKLELRR